MLNEPMIPGVLPSKSRPKIILGQGTDYPPYAFIGKPPSSNYQLEGFSKDFAMGMAKVADIDIHIAQTSWLSCGFEGQLG